MAAELSPRPHNSIRRYAAGALMLLTASTLAACGEETSAQRDPSQPAVEQTVPATENGGVSEMTAPTSAAMPERTSTTSEVASQSVTTEIIGDKSFSATERRELMEALEGYRGLETADVKVAGSFSTTKADVKLLSINGAKPQHEIDRIRDFFAVAESTAKKPNQTFTVPLQLGTGKVENVPFSVIPATEDERFPDKRQRIYMLFADSKSTLDQIASPKRLPEFFSCFTANNVKAGISAVLLSNQGNKVESGVYVKDLCLAVEAFQAMTTIKIDAGFMNYLLTEKPDLGNVSHPAIPGPTYEQRIALLESILRDMAANIQGFGLAKASLGGGESTPYEVYQQEARNRPYTPYPKLAANLQPVNRTTYDRLAAA